MDDLGATEADEREIANEIGASRHPNDDAIRLCLIDQALQHLTRQAGLLGYGANKVQQSLRQERDEVVERLKRYGDTFSQEEVDAARAPRRALSR